MRILLIVAGTNEPSNSNVLGDAFAEGVREQIPSAIIEKIRLKDLDLPHFTLAFYRPGGGSGEPVAGVRRSIEAADGIVFATPVWNFSVPAHLKNLIDLLGAFFLDAETRSRGQLQGKPFFFLFTGGAPVAVWKGIMRFTTSHVPESIRYYGGSIVGKHYEGTCMPSRREFGLVVDRRPASLARARAKGKKFARFVDHLRQTGALPLYYRISAALYRWGQGMAAKLP